MFRNYLTIAFRILWNNKVFSIINILGLAIGMAASLILFQYIRFEKSYDSFHANADRIYRINLQYHTAKWNPILPTHLPACGPMLKEEMNEVIEYTRVLHHSYSKNAFILTVNEDRTHQTYAEEQEKIYYADASVFSMFSFPLVKGDPTTALQESNSIALSQTMARKYFGEGDPIGSLIRIEDWSELENKTYLVTAVFKDVPVNSHLQFDILISFETLNADIPFEVDSYDDLWDHWNQFTTYVQLDKPDVPIKNIEDKAHHHIENYMGPQMEQFKSFFDQNASFKSHFQPLKAIHLNDISPYGFFHEDKSGKMHFLTAISLLIIIIACINYVNLSSAKATQRSREVGLRKVIGANKRHLITQFIVESVLINFFAVTIAVTMIQLVSGPFNQLVQKELLTDQVYDLQFFSEAVIMFLCCILISGLYPAMLLSSFNIIESLKGLFRRNSSRFSLRSSLVLFQFMISVILISGIYTMVQQLKHMDQQNLGFIKDKTISLRVPVKPEYLSKVNAFRENVIQLPGIKYASNSEYVPGVMNYGHFFSRYHENENTDGAEKAAKGCRFFSVDEEYLNTFNIKLLAGRNFSNLDEMDHDAVIINRQAVKDLGFEDLEEAVGSYIVPPKLKIIGVFEDYCHESPKVAVMPMVLQNKGYANKRGSESNRDPWPGQFLSIKLASDDVAKTMALLKDKWNDFFPNLVFDYFFLDENYNIQYADDQQLTKIVGLFSLVAVFITCLGLFGLTLYTTLKRTKEIGIRKALGAPGRNILVLLTKDSFKLIALASIIAIPITYWGIKSWLDNFASRIPMTLGLFTIPVIIVLLIAVTTVSWQIIKATRANPVKALRYE